MILISCSATAWASDLRGIAVNSTARSQGSVWGDYYALIVGINDYKEWPQLKTPVKDSQALKDVLVNQYGFDEKRVVLRTDAQASRTRIISDLRNLASNLKETDNLLIYYAGHGQLDDLTGDGYWIPAEGKLKDPSTWISHFVVKSILSSEKVRGKNIVVVADSCYAGSMLRGGPSLLSIDDQGYQQKLFKAAALRSRQIITSGGVEPVADGGKDGHSLFAYYFLKALSENERQFVDLENLFHTRVWTPVTEIGNQRPNVGRLKTPMDDDGQFVLALQYSKDHSDLIRKDENLQLSGEQEQLKQLKQQIGQLEAERGRLQAEKQLVELKSLLEAERRRNTGEEKQKTGLPDSEERSYHPKTEKQLREENTPQQPTAIAAVSSSEQNINRPKLAIFPWKLINTSHAESDASIQAAAENALNNTIKTDQALFPRYSYYDLKKIETEHISEDIISKKTLDQMWVKKSFFSPAELNVDAICKLGKRLKVDAILTFYILANGTGTASKVTAFLVNVENQKIYSAQHATLNSPFDPTLEFQKLTQKVYADFTKDSF